MSRLPSHHSPSLRHPARVEAQAACARRPATSAPPAPCLRSPRARPPARCAGPLPAAILLALVISILTLILLPPADLQAQHAPQLLRGEISDPDQVALGSRSMSEEQTPSRMGPAPTPVGLIQGPEAPIWIMPPPRTQQDGSERDIAWLWAGGVVGGAAGMGLGILIGLEAHPSLDSPILGGLAGYTVGVPVGVHLANGRRGQPWRTGLASALPMMTFLLFGSGETALIAAASLQLVGSAAAERFGEGRRAEAQGR